MAKVSIATRAQAPASPPPAGVSGGSGTQAYFAGEADPIHLHVHRLADGEGLCLEPTAVDRLAYVWRGEVTAGGHALPQGSSLIVERGGALAVAGTGDEALLAVFAAGQPTAESRAGGGVHILPRDNVPRVGANASGTAGGLHADGHAAGCALWLNENTLPGGGAITEEQARKGIHAHPHDEIIFVTGGQIRLGAKLYDAGTALAIAAHTLYGFSPGPEGLSFITFRNSASNAIRFASGGDYAESDFWKPIAASLAYLEPIAA